MKKNITSISLPVGDTNVWFWGRGRFLMWFYMGGKNESAPFVFSQLKTEKTEMGYTFITVAVIKPDEKTAVKYYIEINGPLISRSSFQRHSIPLDELYP